METVPGNNEVRIKEELVEAPLVTVKPEPLSPGSCPHDHSLPTLPQSQPSSHPPGNHTGKFSSSRAAGNSNKTVDLSSYRYGLYSFFAEGNKDKEFNEPHFDPYYGENDIKDPALLARAKKYFENLRREQCEDIDEFQMREQTSPSTGREHRPMYQRKRKKVQRLVVLVPKIPISGTIQDYLRKRYPCESDRAARCAARKRCRSSETSQEEKLQEFLLQFRSGTSRTKSRPYSVSQRADFSRPPSSCSSQQSNVPETPPSSSSDQLTRREGAPLLPPDFVIKSEHFEDTRGPTLAVKLEMLDCPHNESVIKPEPIEYSQNTENITPNIQSSETPKQPADNSHPQITEGHKKKKKKISCIPFSTKEEPIDETLPPITLPPITSSSHSQTLSTEAESVPDTSTQSETVKIKQESLEPDKMLMVEIFRKRVKKLRKLEVLPMASVKEEPAELEESQPESPPPEIKEEPAEPTLLYFDPKPFIKKKPMMYVYSRRMQGRARMSASHPRGRSSLDAEAEFDNAVKLDVPFSPPKSAWSKITPAVRTAPESDEETEESRGLTAEIDQLIEAGNIRTLDDTERMYNLFASTIKDVADAKSNVFNIVLEKFKESKALDESRQLDEERETSEAEEEGSETESPTKQVLLFPMSDQEIYNQGLAVVGETKPPGEFEFPTVKVEQEEEETGREETVPYTKYGELSPVGRVDPEAESQATDLPLGSDKDCQISEQPTFTESDNGDANRSEQVQLSAPSDDILDRTSPIRIRNTLERLANTANIVRSTPSDPYTPPPPHPHPPPPLPTCSEYEYPARSPAPLYNEENFSNVRMMIDERIKVVDENSEASSYKPDEIRHLSSRQKGDLSEAERLFDEMLAEEQTPFPSQEPAYMEPFSRNDTLFANASLDASTSLDDFIKAPLTTNEHLVKPKPSYVRLSYHDSSESGDASQFKPPTVLFSSKPEDMPPAEWNQWRRHHESFDQFQSSSWTIDEQSNSWSPQHSIYDSYFEPPSTSAAPYDDHQKDSSRLNCFENTALHSWIDGRRLQSTFPIIERNESGQEIIRIPVEQRAVQTQFPKSSKHCSPIETFPPRRTFITQRQDNVTDIATQTDVIPPYNPYLDYCYQPPPSPHHPPPSTHHAPPAPHHPPPSSVLVEPLLSAKKVSRVSPSTPSSEGSTRGVPTLEQRTIQTQYPANNSLYSPFEPSLPFPGALSPNKEPVDSSTQTDGAPLFPPWVAPGRFRRHRPVLVEPLPNIEPIGENVRTMRSSDAYSILMEQIRTCNDPSFDKFMNSQRQPNGIVSQFNQYACYAPQGNSPELPLTVKKNYPKKNGNVCKGKRPGIQYKEVSPQQVPSEHSNRGLTPYQISVKIRKMGQVENIIGRLANPKKRKSLSPKR